MRPAEERFLEKIQVDGESGCWLWTAALGTAGYGIFWTGEGYSGAHRWAYEHWVGPIPAGLMLDHFACDTPRCANPNHVRPATSRENTLRGSGVTAANLAKTHCVNGHEFTPENTYERRDRGGRECRTCRNDAAYRYLARRAS